MAGLTHGAVALSVITGQRSEATPYHTIHRGSHTIHKTCTFPRADYNPGQDNTSVQQKPGIGAASSGGQTEHVGHFGSWFLILTTITIINRLKEAFSMKFWTLRVFLFSFIRYYFYHHYKKCPSKNARVAISRKENVQSGIARPHVGDKTWKVATKSRRQSDQVPHWRDHSQQQMAGQPWAGDNRVARPRWMDDMYTINIRQTLRRAPLCEVGLWTTVEMDGLCTVCGGSRAVIWQGNLLLGLLRNLLVLLLIKLLPRLLRKPRDGVLRNLSSGLFGSDCSSVPILHFFIQEKIKPRRAQMCKLT